MCRLSAKRKAGITAGITNALTFTVNPAPISSVAVDFEDPFECGFEWPDHKPSIAERIGNVDHEITAILQELGETAIERTLTAGDLRDFWELSGVINTHATDIRRLFNLCDDDTGNDDAKMPQATEAFRNYYYCC